MGKKKAMKKKTLMKKTKKVDDFSANDRGQSFAMNLDEKNQKLAKFSERKVKAR